MVRTKKEFQEYKNQTQSDLKLVQMQLQELEKSNFKLQNELSKGCQSCG
jgi:hypothetical protein